MDPINIPPNNISINIPAPWIRHGYDMWISLLHIFWSALRQRREIQAVTVVAGLFPQGRVLLVCNEEDEQVIGGKLEDRQASGWFEFWDLRVWIAAY